MGAGAQSSWINQIHSSTSHSGKVSKTIETAFPYPTSACVVVNGIRADFNNLVDESVEPVSIAEIKSIGRVCEPSAATTSGNHTAPLCVTRTATTRNLSSTAFGAINKPRYLK